MNVVGHQGRAISEAQHEAEGVPLIEGLVRDVWSDFQTQRTCLHRQHPHGIGERSEFSAAYLGTGPDQHHVKHLQADFLTAIAQGTIDIAFRLPFGLGIPLIVELLAASDADVELG